MGRLRWREHANSNQAAAEEKGTKTETLIEKEGVRFVKQQGREWERGQKRRETESRTIAFCCQAYWSRETLFVSERRDNWSCHGPIHRTAKVSQSRFLWLSQGISGSSERNRNRINCEDPQKVFES